VVVMQLVVVLVVVQQQQQQQQQQESTAPSQPCRALAAHTTPACRKPVFLTLCHMMACSTLGYLLSLAHCTPLQPLRSSRQLCKVRINAPTWGLLASTSSVPAWGDADACAGSCTATAATA
jgi:hypothetical protein